MNRPLLLVLISLAGILPDPLTAGVAGPELPGPFLRRRTATAPQDPSGPLRARAVTSSAATNAPSGGVSPAAALPAGSGLQGTRAPVSAPPVTTTQSASPQPPGAAVGARVEPVSSPSPSPVPPSASTPPGLLAAVAPSPADPAPAPVAPPTPAPGPGAAGQTNKPVSLQPRGAVSITGEGGFEYDGETGRVIYKRKVRVLDPEIDPRTIIECEWLTTVLPPPGGMMGELVALTNVVIRIKDEKGMQVATGNRAVYNPTNDIVTIEGSPPVVEMHTGTLYGDERVIYNRQSNRFEAPGKFRIVARPGGPLPFPGPSGTNAPARPPVPKPNP